jgi:hypothetical protein
LLKFTGQELDLLQFTARLNYGPVVFATLNMVKGQINEFSSTEDSPSHATWKALPRSVMDQLHDKGYISDLATKAKSVRLSDEGARLSEELFEELFALK